MTTYIDAAKKPGRMMNAKSTQRNKTFMMNCCCSTTHIYLLLNYLRPLKGFERHRLSLT